MGFSQPRRSLILRSNIFSYGFWPDREDTMVMRRGEGMTTSNIKIVPRTWRKILNAYHTRYIVLFTYLVSGAGYQIQGDVLKTLTVTVGWWRPYCPRCVCLFAQGTWLCFLLHHEHKMSCWPCPQKNIRGATAVSQSQKQAYFTYTRPTSRYIETCR